MLYPKDLKNQALANMQNAKVEGFLPGNGNKNAKLMFVGEAPGKNEIISQKPFSGRAGKELDNYLSKINVTREDIYITSTIRSRPYKEMPNRPISKMPNRKPNQKEIKAHAILLDYEINKVNPKIIATLGDTALKRLTGSTHKLTNDHGKLFKTPIYCFINNQYQLSTKEYYVVPLYHPAAIFYNQKLRQIIEQDWLNLAQYLKTI